MQEAPYRVFISCTTADLGPYRDQLAKSITAAGHVPVVMKDFGPNDHGALAASLQNVRQCDIYVLLAGYRFGTCSPDNPTQSVTQREFEEARRNGMYILAYIPPPPEQMSVEAMKRLFPPRAFADQEPWQLKLQEQFVAGLRRKSMEYLPGVYEHPSRLDAMVITAVLQRMQGRIPGEVAFRRGRAALRNRNGDAAIDQFSRAVAYFSSMLSTSSATDDGETPLYAPPFLLALSLLRGLSPSSLASEEIVGVEDNFKRSLRANATQVAYAIWAYVKWDHYIRRGIVRPHQLELEQMARQCAALAASAPQGTPADGLLAGYVRDYFRDLAAKVTMSANNPPLAPFRRAVALLSGEGSRHG